MLPKYKRWAKFILNITFMKAFLSYDFNDNISEITSLLTRQGVDIFDSRNDIQYGTSFQKAIKNAVSECDFLLLIYSTENPNIAFEAGIAVSSNKPIFSIISEKKNYPDFLFDSTYVHAKPNEIEKIEFNFKIFLDKIKPKKSSVVKKHMYYGGGEPNHYTDIYKKYIDINVKSEKNYELLFKDIFEIYKLSVIQNKFDNNSNFYTDFCIWSDKLSNVIGNPILIEVKKEINTKSLESIIENISKLISNNSAESCLIFYDTLKGIDKKNLPNTSRYLFIQIADFISKLNDGDFNDSIRKIRNEIVHNQF
jgi:hypothetical protein